ncbi:MAG: DNA helicase [Nitrosopumilales archaeon CG_4_9_14_0_2_um_filter_34_16]|nr:MAG: DNA helicase [Nitrosopumilales archaeon CG_4_9_14_0_2_um_filter_34_16]
METSLENIGTLEYVLDKYSKIWSWKVTGDRAVSMISRLVSEAWYGENINEIIIPDSTETVKQLKLIMDRYPLEILSKSIWQRKIVKTYAPKPALPPIKLKLKRAKTGDQFRGKLLNFQKEGLDFLLKSSGNALLADEMGLGKCVLGSSLIEVIDGQIPIEDLWSDSVILEQQEDECWAKLPRPIIIQTFDGQKIIAKKVSKIFRQRIDEDIVKITLDDGSVLECTKRHRFLTPDGWIMTNNLNIDDRVAVPSATLHESKHDLDADLAELMAKKHHNTNIDGIPSQKIVQQIADKGISLRSLRLSTPYKYTQGMSKNLAYFVIDKLEKTNNHVLANDLQKLSLESINWCPIKKIETKRYSGYVYDISVPETHNYVVNGMITHNTVQTLSYVSTEKQTFPVLVIAPLVTLNNWEREIQKFLKKKSRNGRVVESESPSVTIIRTGKSQELPPTDIYLINYELLFKRNNDLSKLGIKTIVCDEVHNLRSKTTQKYKAVKKLAALSSVLYRIGLSGTPIYNRGSEIWPIIDIIKPGLLGSFKEFCEYFCYVNDKGKAIVLENKRASLRNELQKHVMLRRKKSDVLKELKDKVRYKEVIAADTDYYLEELDKIWKKVEAEQKDADSEFSKSASYNRAIQSERQIAGIAKLPHVINFVKNIMEIEESVVVFCHHKVIHKLLNESLQEFSPVTIIGGQSDALRQDQIDKFQRGESKLMIAGIRAGNVGINLTRAKYVIFAELDWSPAIHRQAEDRLHRIGQKNTVFAYYLIGNGTLDDHVANILVDKSYEIDEIMDETKENYENKDKAELILAQIQDKIRSK